MNIKIVLTGAAAALLLTACGGGGTEILPVPPPPVTQVPASATASPTAYVTFAATLTNSETALPLLLDNVTTPPTSETAPPQPL